MSKEPEYILGEGPLKVAVFNQYGNFDFDSIYIMDPSESESKGWEIWYAEWHDTDLRSADLKYKLIEIHSDWITTPEHVHLVYRSLALGYEVGDYDGRTAMQACHRYAQAVLSGKSDMTELYEAAHQHGFGNDETGANFAKRKLV